MKRLYIGTLVLVLCQFFSSCEELIDINLNDADPRIVIEADLNNLSTTQVIYVSRTVPFNDTRPNEVVENAEVRVTRPQGNSILFTYSDEHRGYVNRAFSVRENNTYSLRVTVDGELYEATETMPMRVGVDSVGMLRENIFGDTYYFATLRFQDPAGIDNYYKYNVSVDDRPMKFFAAFSDKFNDGLYVTHQIGSVDNDIEMTSQVLIRRQSISASVFRYWNEIQSTNPGSAAPANPTSNISNGALGYFSVSSAEEFRFDFSNYQEMTTEDNL
ncbi:DUF4249 domain-containing protein [Sphingobacterium sp. lm-10]|uniref:DUF4249 domain-containing protein n=1 Tax=Sphingobacterium sp. lm-10 TaxID=2944904 RepID=UPI00202052F8|nr:DUF4249 domain-containing protein [Sphingobacterium sp. lm-10]MCL7987552.1 DUF4249 domain-containing protein [Sphingobacterium sp. lm-10]